jgi:CRP-like cAMP-binding protein
MINIVENRILAALAPEERAALQPRLTPVALTAGQVLHRQGEPIRYVYFPMGGIVSMATVLPEGTVVEAATVGNEGLVGILAFFADAAVSPYETSVRIPGVQPCAQRMGVADFRRALKTSPTLYGLVADYAAALYSRICRLTACNVRHDVHQRSARWLLSADDHMGGEAVPISQEFLAVMLGVRRQAVSLVVKNFRRDGAIQYARGNIAVTNRAALKKLSCDCYSAIAQLYAPLRAKNRGVGRRAGTETTSGKGPKTR